MSNHNKPTTLAMEDTAKDESMGITSQAKPTEHEIAGATHIPNPEPVTTQTSEDAGNVYEDDDEVGSDPGHETAEEFDAPWLTAALDDLDAKWGRSFDTLQNHLSKDTTANRNELRKIWKAQHKHNNTMDRLTKLIGARFDAVEANQRTILRSQDE